MADYTKREKEEMAYLDSQMRRLIGKGRSMLYGRRNVINSGMSILRKFLRSKSLETTE